MPELRYQPPFFSTALLSKLAICQRWTRGFYVVYIHNVMFHLMLCCLNWYQLSFFCMSFSQLSWVVFAICHMPFSELYQSSFAGIHFTSYHYQNWSLWSWKPELYKETLRKHLNFVVPKEYKPCTSKKLYLFTSLTSIILHRYSH